MLNHTPLATLLYACNTNDFDCNSYPWYFLYLPLVHGHDSLLVVYLVLRSSWQAVGADPF